MSLSVRRVLLLLCVVVNVRGGEGSKVYSDSSTGFDVYEDVEATLAMRDSGNTLIYIFSYSYAKDVLINIKSSSLSVTDNDVFCFDLKTPGDDVIDNIYAVAKARSASSYSHTFLLLSGAESLDSEKEVGKLNFLHSMTDVSVVE